jgi:hypothetical protein
MITLKILEDGNVQVSILAPIVDRKMGDVYTGNGFSPRDLKSYGFSVVMTVEQVREFFGEFVQAYNPFLKELREKEKLQAPEKSS